MIAHKRLPKIVTAGEAKQSPCIDRIASLPTVACNDSFLPFEKRWRCGVARRGATIKSLHRQGGLVTLWN
jgi:hypothetical protein